MKSLLSAYFLSKLGLITAPMLKQYRKYALVGILVIAAIITPTSDVFTLLLVSIPLYFLYELSIQVVGRSRKKKIESGRLLLINKSPEESSILQDF